MAHFAELDENNVVLRVIVVANEDTHDVNGVESEALGIAFCQRLFGINTKWRQTSYNGSLRSNYAGVGFIYHENIDAFSPPKPFPSWTLNNETAFWEPPVPRPELTEEQKEQRIIPVWNEEEQIWTLVNPVAPNDQS